MYRIGIYLFAFCSTLLVAACGRTSDTQAPARNTAAQTEKQTVDQEKKPRTVVMDVGLHSYLDRPIFDVYLNGQDIGLAAGQPHKGSGGLMTGVTVALGPQEITWRLDGVDDKGAPLSDNGSTVVAKNTPELEKPGAEYRYLGVHIYPDNTVEVIPEKFWPEKTAKGQAINLAWEKKHGQ
jgi:hypothetical protein